MAKFIPPADDRCHAQYERTGGRHFGDRVVDCARPYGHDGAHEDEEGGAWVLATDTHGQQHDQSETLDPGQALIAAARAWYANGAFPEQYSAALCAAVEAYEGEQHEHPEDVCHRCYRPNPVWSAPSPLWNAVMRGGTIDGTEIHDGIVCPLCFADLAEQAGIAQLWRFSAERVLVELETVTPSGRIWDERAWMWREPGDQGDTLDPGLAEWERELIEQQQHDRGERRLIRSRWPKPVGRDTVDLAQARDAQERVDRARILDAILSRAIEIEATRAPLLPLADAHQRVQDAAEPQPADEANGKPFADALVDLAANCIVRLIDFAEVNRG